MKHNDWYGIKQIRMEKNGDVVGITLENLWFKHHHQGISPVLWVMMMMIVIIIITY